MTQAPDLLPFFAAHVINRTEDDQPHSEFHTEPEATSDSKICQRILHLAFFSSGFLPEFKMLYSTPSGNYLP